MSDAQANLAALQAQAAAAAAEAARLKAEAAQAAADAAAAALAAATASAGTAPASAPASATTPSATLSALATTVRDGYTFTGPTLSLGGLLEDGTPQPAAQVGLPLGMLNRHGLVAGATGTGKTRTLQLMAESLSDAGVPVFAADVKGDLTGLVRPGTPSEKLTARTAALGQDWSPASYPVEFYALGGQGHGVPVRTTVTEFGPILLSKAMGLNETQESSLGLIFHWADTQGLALVDLEDLRATIAYLVSEDGKAALTGIGGLSTATAGVILRELVTLQSAGAGPFFGEPAFDPAALLRTAPDGRGLISSLELSAVADRPQLFSTFLMWLLAELFEHLPEVGDPDKPKLVFFFDEAHLLFADATDAFLDAVVRTVRLIRSKGVGIVFVTQSPKDIPGAVLGQLGSRVQHALRAFTPDDAKALKQAASTYPTSGYDLTTVLTTLGTGEAVVTVLSETGAPTPVAWTRLRAPRSAMAAADDATVIAAVAASPLMATYGTPVDPESASELLAGRIAQKQAADQAAVQQAAQAKEQAEQQRQSPRSGSGGSRGGSASPVDQFLKLANSSLGREITRGLFRTLIGSR